MGDICAYGTPLTARLKPLFRTIKSCGLESWTAKVVTVQNKISWHSGDLEEKGVYREEKHTIIFICFRETLSVMSISIEKRKFHLLYNVAHGVCG
jgi:hypothetical protein